MTRGEGLPPATAASNPARFLLPIGAVLVLLPWVPIGAALLAGTCVGVLWGNPFATTTRVLARRMLSLSVVGLGAGMDLRVVAHAGLSGIGYTAIGIVCCLALGTLLAKTIGVASRTGLLISVGTAICGGSAIAAVAPVVRAKEDEIAVALATVFVLNALGLVLFPIIGHAVGLDESQFGLWAALAIHDTSSVVGASMAYGPHALEVATAVKLARALWIVPVTIGVGYALSRRASETDQHRVAAKAPRPWFIVGFLAAAALVTFVPALRPAGTLVSWSAKRAMATTLFLIGAGLTRKTLRAVGLRPFAHGVALWVIVAVASLGALLTGLIS